MRRAMPPSSPTWCDLLTLDALTRSFGASTVERALQHDLRYDRPPRLSAVDTVSARFELLRTHAPHLQRAASGGPAPTVALHVERGALRITAGCTCLEWGSFCDHRLALLVDLASSEELRRAVARGADTDALVAEVTAQRATLRDELRARTLVSQWIPLPRVEPAGALAVSLVPVDTRHRIDGSDPYDYPTLELRLHGPGTRSLFDMRQLGTRTLTMLHRRLVTLGTALTRSRKGVALAGVQASIALHLLRESREPVYLGERAAESLRFVDATATLRVERVRLRRAVLAQHDPAVAANLALTEAWNEHVPALEGRWSAPDGLELSAREVILFSGPYPFLWVPSRAAFYPVADTVDLDLAWNLHCKPAVELPERHAAVVYRGLQQTVGARRVKLPRPEDMGLGPRAEAEVTVRLEGRPLDVVARVEAAYDFGVVQLGPDGALAEVPFEHDVRRDLEREREAVARVLAAGLRWSADRAAFEAVDRDAADFWTRGVQGLRAPGEQPLTLLVADNLRGVVVRPPVKARARVSLAGNLLETEFVFDVGELAADIERVREALRNKRRWVALDDGSVSEIADGVAAFVEELDEVLPPRRDGAAKGARARLPAHQLGRVERWLEAGVEGDIDAAVQGFRSRLRALAVSGDPAMPEGLRAELRPYQRQGLAWLQFVDALGAGGVLADDMGLGKTVTTLAMLLWRKERDGAAPSLVVCPTSVAGNWLREAARFTPGLSVLLYHGAARERDLARLEAADVVVTTYALLRRDVEALAKVAWRYAILDEAQNIKNAGALTAQAARELEAERRLALTGTPVENHLGELWSIMDFCNPGMLGTPKEFAARYERGVSLDPRGPEALRLRAMLRPFLLRRTKRDVLRDLPAKQEIDHAVVPGARQRRLYDALAATALADVEKRIAEVGVARSGISILTALLRLRQMACDPRLVDPSQPAAVSAKREAFLELVQALVAEERRALVFSQFVELLTLWRRDLDGLGIAYEYLDGSTRDRDAVVERFQSGAAPLFLVSLKAGGTGLNLTAADTVIHCDPWWNPAVEDQATDRAHRIGQTRAVTVYRLVAKGTVEEKIVALEGRKRELADAVVTGDAGALRGLSTDDVRLLLGGADAAEDFEADDPDEAAPDGRQAPASGDARAPKRRAKRA